MRKLTALTLPTLSVGDHPDPAVPGLIFKVGHRTRTWTLRYRTGNKRMRVTIGHFPAMGLPDARSAARKAMERVEVGAGPVTAPVVHPRKQPSLGDTIDLYERMRQKEGTLTPSVSIGMQTVRRQLASHLGVPVKLVSKADLRAVRDRIGERAPVMANSFLVYTSVVLKWAAAEDLIEANPAESIRRYAVQSRDRVLSLTELACIWHACDRLDTGPAAPAFGRLVKFLIVTGQRLDEGAILKHGDILDATWRQRVNKASRPHTVPLSGLALSLIGSGTAQQYVFARSDGTKIGGLSSLKARLAELAGITANWRLHDLRRSCATGLQDIGVDQMVASSILNHSVAVRGISGVYMRSTMEAGKRDALNRWADEVQRIVGTGETASA